MLPFANKTDLLEALKEDDMLSDVEDFLTGLCAEHEKPKAREQLKRLWDVETRLSPVY